MEGAPEAAAQEAAMHSLLLVKLVHKKVALLNGVLQQRRIGWTAAASRTTSKPFRSLAASGGNPAAAR